MSHIDLGRRASLFVRIVTALEMQARELPNSDDQVADENDHFVRQVLLEADRAQRGTRRLDAKLREIAVVVQDYAIEGDGPAVQELRRRRDALAARLAAVNCETCARAAEKICTGGAADSDVVAHGQCIALLHELLDFVQLRAAELYRSFNDDFEPPGVEFSTSNAHRYADRDLLATFGIHAWTDVSGETASINLEIKDEKFKWETLCQSVYVLAHEFVCHVYQGGAAGFRPNAHDKCSWSEGWMDRLAYELVRHWSQDDAIALPKVFEWHRDSLEEHCHMFHEARYADKQSGTLKAKDRKRRRSARGAFDVIKRCWSAGVRVPAHRVARLSTKLNLCSLTGAEREKIVTWLAVNTVLPGSKRLERTLQACSAFLEHGNAAAFLNELDTIGKE